MSENLPSRHEERVVTVSTAELGAIIAELMRPVMQTMSKILENNTVALEQLSAAQSVQNDRLEALEKQIRLQTPVTSKQAGYLNTAIRAKARALLDKRRIEDKKAVTKLAAMIRRDVVMRFGVETLRDVPRYLYDVGMNFVDIWSDALAVRDVVKEARARAETAGLDARSDGADAPSGAAD